MLLRVVKNFELPNCKVIYMDLEESAPSVKFVYGDILRLELSSIRNGKILFHLFQESSNMLAHPCARLSPIEEVTSFLPCVESINI